MEVEGSGGVGTATVVTGMRGTEWVYCYRKQNGPNLKTAGLWGGGDRII